MTEIHQLTKENHALKKSLREHAEAVDFMSNTINEVNLLNAKLLYVNKLFREHGGAFLSRDSRLKVVDLFDLTKSVREVKLIYASMGTVLSFPRPKPPTPKRTGKRNSKRGDGRGKQQ